MSIDATLAKKQRVTRKGVLSLSILLLCVVGGYLTWLLLAKGHQLSIYPEKVAPTANIEVVQGTAWVWQRTVYTLGGAVELSVSADKFLPETVFITPESSQILEVVLTPAPGDITLNTRPALMDMTWYHNGQVVAVDNAYSTSLAPGEYVFTAQHPFYERAEFTVISESTELTELVESLTPVQGRLLLASSVKGAEVSITPIAQLDAKVADADVRDGAEGTVVHDNVVNDTVIAGTNTNKWERLALPVSLGLLGGEYHIQIKKTGYQVLNDTLVITRLEPIVQRTYILEPEQATVDIVLKPSGGALLVDGKMLAHSDVDPQSAVVTTLIDANQATSFRYSKPGYLPQQVTKTLTAGAQEKITLELRPAQGEVVFSSNVSAEVWLDGRLIGMTPQVMTLPTIGKKVTFKRPYYREQTIAFTPVYQTSIAVTASLPTEFAARRAASLPTAAQRLGISLKRFSPDTITLGSPINEAGRRSDEHPVQVAFSRDILVAQHEITQAQFASALQQPAPVVNGQVNLIGGSKEPQVNVTWQQAVLYANWLSAQEALPPFYRVQNQQIVGVEPAATGYRLLTEAEWEWLAKKANRAKPTKYVWGNRDKVARAHGNFADAQLKGTQPFYFMDYTDQHKGLAPVGSYKADRTGLFDLAGNVAEWVHDRYTLAVPELGQTYTDYLGMSRGQSHVIKGGSFQTGRLKELRAAYRQNDASGRPDVGFRIARYIE